MLMLNVLGQARDNCVFSSVLYFLGWKLSLADVLETSVAVGGAGERPSLASPGPRHGRFNCRLSSQMLERWSDGADGETRTEEASKHGWNRRSLSIFHVENWLINPAA